MNVKKTLFSATLTTGTVVGVNYLYETKFNTIENLSKRLRESCPSSDYNKQAYEEKPIREPYLAQVHSTNCFGLTDSNAIKKCESLKSKILNKSLESLEGGFFKIKDDEESSLGSLVHTHKLMKDLGDHFAVSAKRSFDLSENILRSPELKSTFLGALEISTESKKTLDRVVNELGKKTVVYIKKGGTAEDIADAIKLSGQEKQVFIRNLNRQIFWFKEN